MREMPGNGSVRRWVLTLVLCCLPAVVDGRVARAEESVLAVKVGSLDLVIPPEFVAESAQRPSLWALIPGLDANVAGVRIKVPEDHVALRIPEYVIREPSKERVILFQLTVLRGEEIDRARSPKSVIDAARGWASFRHRIVEADERRGTVRVFRNVEHPVKWNEFRGSADPEASDEEIMTSWIGNCDRPIDASGTVRDGQTCRRTFVIDDVMVTYSVDDQDSTVLPGIEAMLRDLVADWRRS